MTGRAAPEAAAADRDAAETVAERLVRAYGDHDVEALSALYAEDAVIRVGDLEFQGRDAAARFWSDWFTAFPDVSSRIERTFFESGRFVLDWTETGTHMGRLRIGDLEIPARGRSLCWRGVSIYELSGGQIATVDYYVDRLRAAEQLVRQVAVALDIWTRLTRMAARRRERDRKRVKRATGPARERSHPHQPRR
jgi:steroid delta-isomerase-like uncharacterized protein